MIFDFQDSDQGDRVQRLPFRCGAMVAQSAVNRCVTGSSPVTGAKYSKGRFSFKEKRPFVLVDQFDSTLIGFARRKKSREANTRWQKTDVEKDHSLKNCSTPQDFIKKIYAERDPN